MSLLAELIGFLRYGSIKISLLRSWGPHRLNEAQSRITAFNSLLDRNLRNLCNLRIFKFAFGFTPVESNHSPAASCFPGLALGQRSRFG